MAVSGAHAQQLTEALCAAFPSRDALAQMVRFGLNANLATISQGADLQQDAFALITWADAQDRVGELVAAARAANPTNLALQALAAPWGSGATFLPPPLPETFVARPAQYVELKAALLAADPATPVAITTALQGAGGFGKTVLASALCADPDVQARFPDGICWVTLGEQPDVPQLLAALYTHVRGRPPATADIPALVEGLATHWGQQPGLLVLDDAWQEADLAPFLQAGRACTRLVTTRNLAVVPKAHWVRLDEMQTTEAAALLAAHLADPPADLAVLAPLARQLGEWPLLLALAGPVLQQQLALGDPLPQALDFVRDALREEGVTVFDRTADTARRQAVAGTLTLSLRLLQAEERPRYAELAIFPEDQAIPLAVVGGLWGTGAYATKKLVSRLASLALLAFDPPAGMVRLHDVLRRYLAEQLADPAAVHARLVDAWLDLYQLPAGYAWRWLGYHLAAAGRVARWRALRLDYRWLAAKLAATEVASLVADYADTEGDPDLSLVGASLRLALPALAAGPELLAGQLRGRLLDSASAAIQALVAGAAPLEGGPWLQPQTRSLLPPNLALRHTLVGHTEEVVAVAVTADGRRAVSTSHDGTLRVWDLATGACRHTLRGHTELVRAVGVTADGRRAVSASHDGTLRVWDLATGACLHTLRGHTSWVEAVAVTADGGRAVSASWDETLRVWDLATGACLHTLTGHTDWVEAVAVTADGRRAVSASADRTLRVWELATGACLHTLTGHTSYVTAVGVTGDGQLAVSASYDHTLRIWDLATGACLHTLPGHTGRVAAVGVTGDGQLAVSASYDHTLRVWELATGACRATLRGHTNMVGAVGVTPDGRRAVSASADGTLRIWDLATGACRATLAGHTSGVTAVGVTADGQLAVSASADGTLRVWDLTARLIIPTPTGHTSGVTAVGATDDGRRAVSASDDRTLRVWELATGACLHTLTGHTSYVTAMGVTGDGQLAVSASYDHTLRIWDLATGACHATLAGHTGKVEAVAVTSDGGRAVSASHDHTLRVWELATGACLHTLTGHTSYVTAVGVTGDGQLAVSASYDHTLRVWELATGACLHTLTGHTSYVTAVGMTGDGGRAVSASHDHTLRVWELATGACLHTLRGHTGWVTAVGVTPDGRRAVSASGDGTLRVWDLATGTCLAWFVADGAVRCCAFTADGQLVVAGDAAGGVHFLRLAGV